MIVESNIELGSLSVQSIARRKFKEELSVRVTSHIAK